jgi:imidazolonepropionase
MGENTGATLIRGARQLLTLRGSKAPRRGAGMNDLGVIQDGAVLIRGGVVVEAGPTRRVENLASARGATEINAAGRVVLPAFVDSHTHLLFPPGDRGAGPETAVAAIRASSGWLIESRMQSWLNAMLRHGTATVEVKTGCGPDAALETKALRILSGLSNAAVDVVPTFLLRVPEDASDDEAAGIICDLAPRIYRRGTARFADLLWDSRPSRQGLYAHYLQMAAANGLPFKVHADGTGCAAGAALALGHRATSVDHLEHITPEQAHLLANSRTVVTLLPAAAVYGDGPVAPARAIIEGGAAVALASNCNSHLSPVFSMQAVIALACLHMAMTPAEAISGATINGAHAVGLASRVGSLEPGKDADLLVLNAEDYRQAARSFGGNLVHLAMKRGRCVYREGRVEVARQ